MPEQFENSEATKLEDETISDATAEKRIEHVAEKLRRNPRKLNSGMTGITISFRSNLLVEAFLL